MAKLNHSNDKENVIFVEYNESLARDIAKKYRYFLEAVGKL